MDSINKFRTIVQLALIDNDLSECEVELTKKIGQDFSLSNEQIKTILQEELSAKSLVLNPIKEYDLDNKIDFLVDLVRVMKSDGEIYLSEIRFCEKAAKNMGFSKKSISYLTQHVFNSVPIDWSLVHKDMRHLVA